MAFTAQQKREQRAAERLARESGKTPEAPAVRKTRERKETPPTQAEKLNAAQISNPGASRSATGRIATPSSAGGKVIVGCKVGLAYLDLQLQRKITVSENTQTGPRDVSKYERIGEVVRIRGTAYPRGTLPEGFPEKPRMKDGAAMTDGVDAHFMQEWLDQNHLNPLVLNRMVFIAENEIDFAAMAKEVADLNSGFEPIDPKGDMRIPRPTNANLSKLETVVAKPT